MTEKKWTIAIVNSSSFGISYPEHLRDLEKFARLIRVDIPNNAPASEFHEKLGEADGIIASVTPVYTREVLRGLPKLRLLARHGVGCDNVDLVSRSGGIEVRVAGRALGAAGENERLNVENLSSRKIVQGVVDASGAVLVNR